MIKFCAIAEGYFFFHRQVAHRFAVQNLTLPPSMSVAKVTEYVQRLWVILKWYIKVDHRFAVQNLTLPPSMLVAKVGIPTMLCYTARRRQMFLADHLSFDKICNKSLLRIKSEHQMIKILPTTRYIRRTQLLLPPTLKVAKSDFEPRIAEQLAHERKSTPWLSREPWSWPFMGKSLSDIHGSRWSEDPNSGWFRINFPQI